MPCFLHAWPTWQLYYVPSHQVEELLLGDPDNSELEEMYSSLTEVIQLTQDLLKDALEQQHAAPSGLPPSGVCWGKLNNHVTTALMLILMH